MLKDLTLEEVQASAPGGEITEAGAFFRSASRNAKSAGYSDYIEVLLPHSLPIDKDGDYIPVGEFHDTRFLELIHALGGEIILIRTGKFFPPTEENPAPTIELRHPKDSQDVAVQVAWDRQRGYPIRDTGGLHGPFGTKYGASWYKRYQIAPCTRFGSCLHDCCGEDVWILPANGPIKRILDYLSAQTDREIDEGDAAARIREDAEREYQAHKAEYRAELETSGLIEQFRKACERDGDVAFELKDDYVEITCPTGTDHIPYDENLMAAVQSLIATAERCNFYEDSNLLGLLVQTPAFGVIIDLLL